MSLGASFASGCGGRSVRSLGSEPGPSEAGRDGAPGASGGSGGDMGARGGAAGSGGSGVTAGAAGEPTCPGPIVLEPIAPAIELLVDSSGSLRRPWVDETTRFQFVRSALSDSISRLAPEVAAGLVFYPNVQWSAGIDGEGDDFCLLTYESAELASLSDAHRADLLDALGAQPTLGATPTHDAYDYAISLLSERSDLRSKVAVLVTDGAPTYAAGCVGDGVTPVDGGPLADAARDAFVTYGIRTFVIGISGGFESLSQMAFAGSTGRPGCETALGYPCHFDASDALAPGSYLESSLAIIEREAARCVLAEPETYPEHVTPTWIALASPTGEASVVPRVPPGTRCTEGFMHREDSGTYVLCPHTCARFAAEPELRATLGFECVEPRSPAGSK